MINFQKDILEKSKERPLLVDYWAPWCGPCQVLGPILEDLASSQNKWELVKINVDENTSLSQQLAIRGIPDVRLYVNGKEKSRFTGALPKYQIEKWLNENLPDPVSIEFEEIIKNADTSIDALKRFMLQHPEFSAAKIEYASRILLDNTYECKQLTSNWPVEDKNKEKANALSLLADWILNEHINENHIDDLLNKSATELKCNNVEESVKLLIEAVRIDKEYKDGLPRKLTIAVFLWLGAHHPITVTFRRIFDRSLY